MYGDADHGARKSRQGEDLEQYPGKQNHRNCDGKSAGGKRRAQADGKEKGAKPENDYFGYEEKRRGSSAKRQHRDPYRDDETRFSNAKHQAPHGGLTAHLCFVE